MLLTVFVVFTLTACGKDQKEESSNKENEISQQEKTIEKETKEEEKQQNNIVEEKQQENSNIVIDDEIIEFDDEENKPPIIEGTVTVSEVINCPGCVYAYFSKEGDEAVRLGSTLSSSDYTTDINNLKTAGGKQRHNFFGLVLSGNTISRAYSCILKNNKIYCIEGSTNGAYHNSNISILNMIFKTDECKTISDGHTYTCSDGNYNGDTKTSGYTSLHYETSCTIYGSNARTGELICH